MGETKVCKTCMVELEVERFWIKEWYVKSDGSRIKRLQAHCKTCMSIKVNESGLDPARVEARRSVSRKYVEKNREKIRQRQKQAKNWRKPQQREKRVAYKAAKRREAGAVPREQLKEEAQLAKEVRLRAQHARFLRRARERAANPKRMPPGLSDAEQYRWRYANDPEFQLKERLRNQVKKHAKRYGYVNHYFGSAARGKIRSEDIWDLVGYSASTLRRHLERQFTRGMTWEKFLSGEIHIDHIVPKSTFDLDSLKELRACYALSNLRPLFARDNLRKRDARVSLL